MKRTLLFLLASVYFWSITTEACTNFIVTKGASKDGSAFLAYTNDAEYIYQLYTQEAKNYPKGSMLKLTNAEGITGEIPQALHTYKLLGFHMNEHQLMIGETTTTGRLELWDHKNYIEYPQLMKIALERAKTAREAVSVITGIIDKYGYGSEGETFSIVDKNEAWLLEVFGTGEGSNGAVWVAVKIPDGYISAHANRARIGEFPLKDPQNCLYSKNVISFAIAKGYYNPKTDGSFRFNDVYCPATCATLKYCESRVWSMFRKAAPSLNLSPDYHRCIEGAQRYPLYIIPDQKLSYTDVKEIIRDHYEGTPFDMTKGLQAGPFGNPNHNRPLEWKCEDQTYSWERPVSTFNSAFCFIGQARSFLPDSIGGVIWFGVDDSYFSCFVPLHNSINDCPKPFRVGDIKEFSWESAWWVLNLVSNYCNLKYSQMMPEMKKIQKQVEEKMEMENTEMEKICLSTPSLSSSTAFNELSKTHTEMMMTEWTKLFYYLVCKYNDGYEKNTDGKVSAPGYPMFWYKTIIQNDSMKYRVPRTPAPSDESKRAY